MPLIYDFLSLVISSIGIKAYGEIQKLGIEDFSTAAAASGSIPLTQTASRSKLAEVYAVAE